MNIVKIALLLFGLLLLFLPACSQQRPAIPVERLFTLLPAEYTHIEFENSLRDEMNFNVFKYRNYYNGGGVAIGDVNHDGRPDVYLTANRGPNKLFLNEGDFRFRDVTDAAGVAGRRQWSTGPCMADVNGDGWLDIYVCNSGNIEGDDRANELFINQGAGADGVPLFREAAAAYGVDDRGFSTHAAFFDYDRDGDLDLYVLNNAFRPLSTFDLSKNLRHEPDPHGGGDRLYRNPSAGSGQASSSSQPGAGAVATDQKFTDVTDAAGIYSSVIAFGLGVSVSDINSDGWPDIYIANDFFERDYLYINNTDGTFSERLEEMMPHVSLSSMGADIADLNNDGRVDLAGTDMLPEDDYRLKTTFTFDTFDRVEKQVEWGYYHQLSRNVLQLNNGFLPQLHGVPVFSDIGLLAGIAATDWSWGAIVADLDNDGWKDIFISNGIYRDVTDQDYLAYLMNHKNLRQIMLGDRIDFPELIQKMPSTPLPNYAFHNQTDPADPDRVPVFANRAAEWGLDSLSFSNGVAYGDLDGDGDLDLVINNVNQPVFVYRNESDTLRGHHYLQVKLVGEGMNRFAIGAKVTLRFTGGDMQVLEQMPMRGFQSSVDYVLTFGLGNRSRVDTLIVEWPDGESTIRTNLAANQTVTLSQNEQRPDSTPRAPGPTEGEHRVFRDITDTFPLQLTHLENQFIDFQREPLLPRKLSTEGPRIAVGDVNRDGRQDLYFCAAKGTPGQLLIQTAGGSFVRTAEAVFEKTAISEDVDAAFFDADGDGDLDLYVVSGGNEYSAQAPALLDRLYVNEGRGGFRHVAEALPKVYASGSCVAPADFDGDGDIDLFVGSRSIPWRYGLTPESYLLENNGRGQFAIVTEAVAAELRQVGMVTDARWADVDRDGDPDLVVVGDWMPIKIFLNNGGRLADASAAAGLEKTNGWWNCVRIADLNGDGFLDIIAGNLGHNAHFRPGEAEPTALYAGDFDRNGWMEQIVCFYKQGKSYPLPLLADLVKQVPALRRKFSTNASYAGKSITEIFSAAELQKVEVKYAYTGATTVFWGGADGKFRAQALPLTAQFAPVFAVLLQDFDGDGHTDLLLAGNFFGNTPQLGRYDASYGTLLKGDGAGGFVTVPMAHSGLFITGETRDLVPVTIGKRRVIICAKNNDRAQIYQVRSGAEPPGISESKSIRAKK